MSGFQNNHLQAHVTSDNRTGERRLSEISWSEVEIHVRRARAIRSAYITDWLKRTAQSWGSVFRRPGHQLAGAHYRWRPSTQER
ncbi:MAG: hypothetical protein IPM60_12675 [Rhodospirillales bacterium]|nr:hypothetical protein [Rhodospirillales bacterium]